jgi:hypothetical protein
MGEEEQEIVICFDRFSKAGVASLDTRKYRNGGQHMHQNHTTINKDHYRHLFIMAILSFISMYVLMYAMVNFIGNLSQFQPVLCGRPDSPMH